MSVGVEIGGSLELAIGKLGELHARHMRELRDELHKLTLPPTIARLSAQLVADAAGNIGGGFQSPADPAVILRCPQGMAMKVHRIAVNAPGVTPLAPLATGSLAWYLNSPEPQSNLAMILPSGGTALAPLVITEGSDAVWLSDGDTLVVAGAGLPANQVLNIGLQVELFRQSQPGIAGTW